MGTGGVRRAALQGLFPEPLLVWGLGTPCGEEDPVPRGQRLPLEVTAESECHLPPAATWLVPRNTAQVEQRR